MTRNGTEESEFESLQVTGLARSFDKIDLEAHVEAVTEGVIVNSSYTPSKASGKTQANFRIATRFEPNIAAQLLRESSPWRGQTLHVEVAKVSKKNVETRNLAEGFHAYVVNDASVLERCWDREGASVVFREFLESATDKKHTTSLEGSVMTRLRQMKLLKTKRYGETVVMCFADSPRVFPSLANREEIKERVTKQKEEEEADKEGVTVTMEGEVPDVVPVRDKIAFRIKIAATADANAHTELTTVEVSGAQKKRFKIEPMALPMLLWADETIKVHFASTGTGIYRAIVRMHFRNENGEFTISRHLKVRSGDPTMENILKPTAPYQKKKKRRDKKPKEVVPAPPPAGRSGTNPFANLPQKKVPKEVKQMIQNRELEAALQKPTDSIETYEDFWKHLLWASEEMAHEDIKLYDMEGARFTREGKYLVLTVPGLAEGRPSVLRGDMVKVKWNSREYQGRVYQVRLLDLLIEFSPSFHRTFDVHIDTADVRFTFTRTTFRTSHEGCRLAPSTMGARMLIPQLVEDGTSEDQRDLPRTINFANHDINEEQKAAVTRIVAGGLRPLPYIIFGPPGTGKTTTVTEAIYQLVRHKDNLKVLLVAPSNDAADILVEKLSVYFPPSEMRRILAFTRSLDQLAPAVRPYATDGLSSEAQAAEIMSVRIVVSTVNLAARFAYFGVPRGHFDVLCVDEAGHATEPEVIGVAATLMDFTKNDSSVGQLILAGDPRQLGPVITSDLCVKFGMNVSYMERLTKTDVYSRKEDGQYPTELLTKLVRNYRSHPAILKLPNEMFYDNELLVRGDLMRISSMTRWEHLPMPHFPVVFHAVNGENLREGNSPSWFNPQEVEEVVNYVELLVNQSRPAVALDDIGIITPYARQAQKIRLALKTRNFDSIKVGSVETFQGQERRCVIVSTVRSESEFIDSDLKYNLGFVANEKRFNVAITRAQSLVVVIGCPSVLAMDKKNWLPFLRYCRDNGSWLGQEWEEEIEDDEEADDDDEEAGLSSSSAGSNSWDLVGDSPSKAVEEEGMVFINREE